MSSFHHYLGSLTGVQQFLPDEYHLDSRQSEAHQLEIPDSFVLSRITSGAVLSTYGNHAWDFSPYLPSCYCILNFNTWLNDAGENDFLFCQIRAEMKKIIFALLYVKAGRSIIKSIDNRHTVLRYFAALAYRNGCTLQQLFTDDAYLAKVQDAYVGIDYPTATKIKGLLKDCFEIQRHYRGLIPALTTYKPIQQLEQIAAQLQRQSNKVGAQTKLIPSRIYMELINGLAERLDEFNQYGAVLFEWFSRIAQDKTFARMPREFKNYKRAVSFTDARDLLELTQLFERHHIHKHANLTRYITLVQGMAKLWIHLFTGMRDNEVNQLPYGCYQKISSDEHEIHVLAGYTSKLHGGGNKSTYWITFEDIQLGVKAAQRIGEIYAILNPHYDLSDPAEFPLFPARYSQQYRHKRNKNLTKSTDFISHFDGAPVRSQTNFNGYLTDIAALFGDELRIRSQDIAELENFDGFRSWCEEKDCQIGAYWNICTHQFRRSLAVYGARSGLIGLGALSVQFKHLTEAMTLYYRENAVFAPNILASGSQKEFIEELEYQRLIHSYAQFEQGVINSNSRLSGGAGTYLQLQKERNNLLKVFPNREETIKRMRKGEIAYKPSLFGACTNPDPCEKVAFTAISSCLNCAHAVFDAKSIQKMQRTVQRMRCLQKSYTQDSLLYRQADHEVAALSQAIEKFNTLNKEV